MFLVLNDENFEKEISGVEKPVLVDFWMKGCPPCDLIAPVLEKLAREFEEKVIFIKANLDDIPLTVRKYGIDAAPTIILFKKEEPISGFVGLKPEEEIRSWLEESLLILEYREYAEKNGFSLNPNRKILERLVKCMLEREKQFGKRYCCCRKITGNLVEDEKIVCPCIYAPKEITEQGRCLCMLFFKK